MKYFYSFFLVGLLALTATLSAQNYDHCGTMDRLDWKMQTEPQYRHSMEAAETAARNWLADHRSQVGGAVLTIPTVVHIVYTAPEENLSDAQIWSQIDVLNEDFRMLNADTSLRRPEFDSLASDFEIEFCLATTDPFGNPTTGITRTSSSGGQLLGFFGPLDDVKSSATGGIEPWPTDKYLNIWVCNLLPIIAGYAQFPGDDPATDGVVIGYSFFGRTGDLTPPYNKGRTTTHEVGHWLGLRHIWGDGDCTMDDFVDDTPKADANSNGACFAVNNTCVDSLYDYIDMVENYMDYSQDSCMNTFTHGQKARSWSFLNTDRLGLFTSNGCSLSVARDIPLVRDDLFTLFPNPGTEVCYLQWFGLDGEAIELNIINTLGQNVYHESVASVGRKTKIDLSEMPAGAYIVRVESASGIQVERLTIR